MTKLLCCVLNGEYHAKWKDQDARILCTGCITDLLEKEYAGPKGELATNLLLEEFKFLHTIADCNCACENTSDLIAEEFIGFDRHPKII